MNKFIRTGTSILQLANEANACIVDLVALKASKKADAALAEIFRNQSTIVGFGFQSDLFEFNRSLPDLSFYKVIKKFCDLQGVHKKASGSDKLISLAKLVKEVLDIDLCKKE